MNAPWGTHLYVAQMAGTGAIKVGRSCDPERRRVELQTGCPHTIKLIVVLEGAGHREKEVHAKLARHMTRSYSGEWFHENAWGEMPAWIYDRLSPEMLELINSDWWRSEAPTRPPGPT